MLAANLFALFCIGSVWKANRTFFLYVALSMCVVLFSVCTMSVNDGAKALNYAMCFLVGYNAFLKAEDPIRFLYRLAIAFFIGYGGYVVLLFVKNYNFVTSLRLLQDVWTSEYLSVTLVAVLSSVVLGCSVFLLFFEPTKWLKILAATSLVVVVTLNFRTATRTPFILLIVLIALALYLQVRAANNVQKVKIFVVYLIVMIVVVIAYAVDLFSIRTTIENSFLWSRFQKTDSASRTDIMLWHLSHSLEFPFGGGKISEAVGKNGHNAVQDFYDTYGALPGIFYLVITVSQYRTWRKLLKLQNWQKQDYLLMLLLFVIGIQMWTEPMVTGYPIYIWTMCILHGAASAYLENRNVLVA